MLQRGMPVGQAYQPKTLEPGRGHSLVSRWALGHPPPTFAAGCSRPRTVLRDTQALQKHRDRQGPLQGYQVATALRIPEVRHPPRQERVEFAHHAFQADAPVPLGDLTDAGFDPL